MLREAELERCYDRARVLVGDDAEPFSVVQTVESHRNYWRPARVRVLLLAESHVYTKAQECVPMGGAGMFELRDCPQRFIRLVYCLGYGESEYVGAHPLSNTGTPQYWKIFSSCVYPIDASAFGAVLKRQTPGFHARLSAKIDLLNRLRQVGVWLVDASVLALYTPGGNKPSAGVRQKVLRACWDAYIGHLVADAAPERVIVIGKGVGAALADRLKDVTGGRHIVLNQPQARMSVDEITRTHNTYFDVCREGAASPG